MRRSNQLKAKETSSLKAIIKEKTGFQFTGDSLMIQAFTRSSYAKEMGIESNEILEFIGDQVLSYYTVKLISERVGAFNTDMQYRFRIGENRFSQIKGKLLSNENLARIIDEWDVMDYLIVGKSDYQQNVANQMKVKADTLEAIVGFIAMKSKWNEKVLEKAVKQILSLDDHLDKFVKSVYRLPKFTMENAVTTLKELAEQQRCTMPEYEFTCLEKPRKNQDNLIIWNCRCSTVDEKTGYTRSVFSYSKKKAKHAVAYLILCTMFDLQNEYGENSPTSVWYYFNDKLTVNDDENVMSI
ncbi:MAG: ribonuclease III family protein [Erysipelotrichaceae bacterium]|nr:ribonuclease III family protein [Erysipelotrichaceae bacterium]